jgi:hypothetical protein
VDDDAFGRGWHYEVLDVGALSAFSERKLRSLASSLGDLASYCVYRLRVPEPYRAVEEKHEFQLVAPSGFSTGDRVVLGGTVGNTVFATLGAEETETSIDWATELHRWSNE